MRRDRRSIKRDVLHDAQLPAESKCGLPVLFVAMMPFGRTHARIKKPGAACATTGHPRALPTVSAILIPTPSAAGARATRSTSHPNFRWSRRVAHRNQPIHRSASTRAVKWFLFGVGAQAGACQPASAHSSPLTAEFVSMKQMASAISSGRISRPN